MSQHVISLLGPEYQGRPLVKSDIAKIFGVSLATVNRWLANRSLPYTKIGGRVYFIPADIDAALSRRRVADKSEVEVS